MSIQTEITRLNTAKANILTSISNKGVDTSSVNTLNDIPPLIDSITGGGSGNGGDYNIAVTIDGNTQELAITDAEGSGGGSEEMEALIKRTITSYSSDTLTSVGAFAFHSCTRLTTVSLPNATTLGTSSFNACSSLVSIELPKVTSITTQSFYGCDALETLNLPSVKTTGTQGVRHCDKLTRVDFGAVTNIGALTFDSCPLLETLIVRTPSVCTLGNISALNGTKIAGGTGYIYVPDNLIDQYKTASNWSTYASQIKGLSEL